MKITKDLTKEAFIGKNTKKFVIIHHTGSTPQTTFENIVHYFKKKDYISIHYVVGRNGEVTQLVDENDRAYHAGVSEWKGIKNLNDHSIGIEVLSDGITFTSAQREATIVLIKDIIQRNNIPSDNILRHADVAMPRGRKTDIGVNFFLPYGSWAGFQSLFNDERTKLEKEFTDKAKKLNDALEAFNDCKKRLAQLKDVDFVPMEIVIKDSKGDCY